MLKKLNNFVQRKIIANYNKIKKSETTYEDAAFYTFLTWLEALGYVVFGIFSLISLTLFVKHEIIPHIW
jgi:hypothetical protein